MQSITARINGMKKLFYLLVFLFCGDEALTQIVLERQAISSFALNVCESHCMNSTVGQVDYITIGNTNSVVTSGFEQPSGDLALSVLLDITYNTCLNQYEAAITQLNGCENADSVLITWNGFVGGMTAISLPSLTTLDILSSGGCSYHAAFDFTTMNVTEIPCDLIFYTYMSPNDDGHNDYWEIANIENERFAGSEVTIFNRWGLKVWEIKEYDNAARCWHGEGLTGEPLPDGTYYYVAEANGKSYNGYVELIR
jgi:gliding motility-associated-like protein